MNNSFLGKIQNIIWVLLVGLLIFMPFSTFVLQVLRYGFELLHHPLSNSLIKASVGWKELIALLGSLLFLLLWMIGRKFPFKVSYFDGYIILFILFGTLVGGLIAHRLSFLVFGFRYDFLVFVFYFLARSAHVSREALLRLMKALVLCSLPIILFALLQTFVLPTTIMQRFGYHFGGTSITGNPLPPYHLIGNHIVRAMATFPGPNSLAFYAVMIFLLLLFLGKHWFHSFIRMPFLILSLLTLVITFSRGHLISLVATLFLLAVFYFLTSPSSSFLVKMRRPAFVAGYLIILGVLFAAVLLFGNLKQTNSRILTFVLHDESTEIHRSVRLQAWQSIKHSPLGTGLGTSGLATTNTGGVVINPESWYIQITQEFGWLGLLLGIGVAVLFLMGAVQLESDLHDPLDRQLVYFFLAGFLAIGFSANFLPSWFEVASILWWTLFGMFLSDYFQTFPLRAKAFPIQVNA